MNEMEKQPREVIDAGACLAEALGRIKTGEASAQEIDELIAKRTSIGKRGRRRYGRLVCEFEGCKAPCNVEIRDGILVEKDWQQALALWEECSVYKDLAVPKNDPTPWASQ